MILLMLSGLICHGNGIVGLCDFNEFCLPIAVHSGLYAKVTNRFECLLSAQDSFDFNCSIPNQLVCLRIFACLLGLFGPRVG